MFQYNKTAAAFGAGIKAAIMAMKNTGDKFQSVLPTVGIAALSARETEGISNISSGEKEPQRLLQPVDNTLKTMAIEFAEYQLFVDVFLTTQSYVDIASISVIPKTTGGQANAASGMAVHDECKLKFMDLKAKRTHHFFGALFFSYMVEDKSPSGLTYVEFLVHVHRQIQSKMA